MGIVAYSRIFEIRSLLKKRTPDKDVAFAGGLRWGVILAVR